MRCFKMYSFDTFMSVAYLSYSNQIVLYFKYKSQTIMARLKCIIRMDLSEHIFGIFYTWSTSIYHYLLNTIKLAKAFIISNVRLSGVWQLTFVLYAQRVCLHLTLTNSLGLSFIHKLVGFPPNFVLLSPGGSILSLVWDEYWEFFI